MPEIVKFKAFCIERYKHAHNLSGRETLRLFKQQGIMNYIDNCFDMLHTLGERRIIADLHEMIAN